MDGVSFDSESTNSMAVPVQPTRGKRNRACVSCKKLKKACIGFPCQNCIRKNIPCVSWSGSVDTSGLDTCEGTLEGQEDNPGNLELGRSRLESRAQQRHFEEEAAADAVSAQPVLHQRRVPKRTAPLQMKEDKPRARHAHQPHYPPPHKAAAMDNNGGNFFPGGMSLFRSEQIHNELDKTVMLSAFSEAAIPLFLDFFYKGLSSKNKNQVWGSPFACTVMCAFGARTIGNPNLNGLMREKIRYEARKQFDKFEDGIPQALGMASLFVLGEDRKLSAHYCAIASSIAGNLLSAAQRKKALMQAQQQQQQQPHQQDQQDQQQQQQPDQQQQQQQPQQDNAAAAAAAVDDDTIQPEHFRYLMFVADPAFLNEEEVLSCKNLIMDDTFFKNLSAKQRFGITRITIKSELLLRCPQHREIIFSLNENYVNYMQSFAFPIPSLDPVSAAQLYPVLDRTVVYLACELPQNDPTYWGGIVCTLGVKCLVAALAGDRERAASVAAELMKLPFPEPKSLQLIASLFFMDVCFLASSTRYFGPHSPVLDFYFRLLLALGAVYPSANVAAVSLRADF